MEIFSRVVEVNFDSCIKRYDECVAEMIRMDRTVLGRETERNRKREKRKIKREGDDKRKKKIKRIW